jgi:glycosyltransferase involved in cell wall biosynthesis
VCSSDLSSDGTREVIESLIVKYKFLRLIDNPKKIVSAGLNLAINEASGIVIIRMDVHTKYAVDYVLNCVEQLKLTKATCVGGAWHALGNSKKQKSISAAFQSGIGSGGAASRKESVSGYVDTIYLGAWLKDDLLRCGGFDENLVRNQDDELCLRIKKLGGTLWQSEKIKSFYFPRDSFWALFRQYLQYGYWKFPVMLKHKTVASIRHILPGVTLMLFNLALFLSLIYPSLLLFVMLLSSLYVLMLMVFVWVQYRNNLNDTKFIYIVYAVGIMHTSYALGFSLGVLDFCILRKVMRNFMAKITRQ